MGEGVVTSLFRAYIAMLRKLEDSGFVVPRDAWLSMEEFVANYGMLRKRMTRVFRRHGSPVDRVLVFWYGGRTLSAPTLRAYTKVMKREKVFCAIVVATYVVSDDARAEMARCTPGYFLSAITERDLRIQFG
jgi:hypothetical protein